MNYGEDIFIYDTEKYHLFVLCLNQWDRLGNNIDPGCPFSPINKLNYKLNFHF